MIHINLKFFELYIGRKSSRYSVKNKIGKMHTTIRIGKHIFSTMSGFRKLET